MDKSPIVRLGDPVLRRPCDEVKFPNPELKNIIAAMFLVMYKSHGVGLAANQIGLNDRIAVVDIHDEAPLTLINPIIIESTGTERMIEGCLSLPGFSHEVDRGLDIKVRNFDVDGNESIIELHGYKARAVQHETDHLNGKVFIDNLTTVERSLIAGKIKTLIRSYKKEAKGMPF